MRAAAVVAAAAAASWQDCMAAVHAQKHAYAAQRRCEQRFAVRFHWSAYAPRSRGAVGPGRGRVSPRVETKI